MKSLGKRKSRRRKTRKVGGTYSRLGAILYTIKKTYLPKILHEMKAILRPSRYEEFQLLTNKFKILTEDLFEKTTHPEVNGPVTEDDRFYYQDKYREWRDLLDHPRFLYDASLLRRVVGEQHQNAIYIVNSRIAKCVDEVVNPDDHDPFIEREYREEVDRLRREAADRVVQTAIQNRVARESRSRPRSRPQN
jgi:hypothetical protein